MKLMPPNVGLGRAHDKTYADRNGVNVARGKKEMWVPPKRRVNGDVKISGNRGTERRLITEARPLVFKGNPDTYPEDDGHLSKVRTNLRPSRTRAETRDAQSNLKWHTGFWGVMAEKRCYW
ncbi:hypothetical protein M407DRAFT_5777 [Tulasnella calospora MUT 4182]|uniref:Uncharacterized protein n=1 Tax=Tulasnella calospora MUT 4182 TaxID=1051891 RepID=A0A0C3QRB2_9AGAM|nr:hypothetical protein M407DRAFT_5777 [Tulasnella calospora MUT 4182]